MRLGLVLWWAVVMAGVGGRARHTPPSLLPTMPRVMQDKITPRYMMARGEAQDTSHATPKRDTSQKEEKDGVVQDEIIHSEELLEKYGYLECVPPGSESNTRLHRLLLYRRRRHLASPRYDTLDVRLLMPHRRMMISDAQVNHYSEYTEHAGRSNSRAKMLAEEDVHLPAAKESLVGQLRRTRRSTVQTVTSERHTVTVWDPFTGQLHYLPICSEQDIHKAVQKFQTVYHVGVKGALDPSTVGLLTSPRCGNPDTMMEEPEDGIAGHEATGGGIRTRRSAQPPNLPQHNSTLNISQGSAADSTDSKDVATTKTGERLPDQELLERIAKGLREATDDHHPQVDPHPEWEPHPEEALRRRRRWVEELQERYQSGEEDARLTSLASRLANDTSHHNRKKRSLYSHLGRYFSAGLIRWRLVTAGYSSQLDVGAQRASLALAFRMWSEVIPPIFLEHSTTATDAADISIGFGKRSHLGCVTEFDGLGGELGHTLRPAQDAQIHMDDDEHFTLNSEHGTNLLKVAVHEIGHVLGLGHVASRDSVMHAVYERVLPNQGFELGWQDRRRVQKIYGPCVGGFDTVFDFLRWRPDGSLSYNTFFFRKSHFWMYENRYNRTRFGDPLDIKPEWGGLPARLDGYAHVFTHTKDIHLFFKGAFYYVFDPAVERVAPGYPRRIAQDFHGPPTAKRPRGRTIPNNIDTVYFDKRDENLYFIKGRKVYGYDVSKGSSGCCLPGYPRRVHEEFPAAPSSRRLPRGLQAAYYSYTHQKLFFIQGQRFWEVSTFHSHDRQRNNTVVGPLFLPNKWYDICDTKLDPYETNA